MVVSNFEEMTEDIKERVNNGFEIMLADRQALIYALLALMLDNGLYDYHVSRATFDTLVNHGIRYAFDRDEEKLVISVIFPEEAKGILDDERSE
jgi:hypothetical protein